VVSTLYEHEHLPDGSLRALEIRAQVPVLIDWYFAEANEGAKRALRSLTLAYLEELEDIDPASRDFVAMARKTLEGETYA